MTSPWTDHARERIEIDFAEAGRCASRAADSRQAAMATFSSVDARGGALRIELRIVLIGLDQRRFQRVGRRRLQRSARPAHWRREVPPLRATPPHLDAYETPYPTPTHARLPRPEIAPSPAGGPRELNHTQLRRPVKPLLKTTSSGKAKCWGFRATVGGGAPVLIFRNQNTKLGGCAKPGRSGAAASKIGRPLHSPPTAR